jgi:hypothetical protein
MNAIQIRKRVAFPLAGAEPVIPGAHNAQYGQNCWFLCSLCSLCALWTPIHTDFETPLRGL